MAYLFNNGTDQPELLFDGAPPVCCVYNGEIVWLPNIPESYRIYIELESPNNLCLNGMSYNDYTCTTADFYDNGSSPDAAYFINNTWHGISWSEVGKMIDYNDANGYQAYCDELTFRVSAYGDQFDNFQFKTNQYYQPTVTAKITVNEIGTRDSKTVASKNVVLQPNTTYTINRGDRD